MAFFEPEGGRSVSEAFSAWTPTMIPSRFPMPDSSSRRFHRRDHHRRAPRKRTSNQCRLNSRRRPNSPPRRFSPQRLSGEGVSTTHEWIAWMVREIEQAFDQRYRQEKTRNERAKAPRAKSSTGDDPRRIMRIRTASILIGRGVRNRPVESNPSSSWSGHMRERRRSSSARMRTTEERARQPPSPSREWRSWHPASASKRFVDEDDPTYLESMASISSVPQEEPARRGRSTWSDRRVVSMPESVAHVGGGTRESLIRFFDRSPPPPPPNPGTRRFYRSSVECRSGSSCGSSGGGGGGEDEREPMDGRSIAVIHSFH